VTAAHDNRPTSRASHRAIGVRSHGSLSHSVFWPHPSNDLRRHRLHRGTPEHIHWIYTTVLDCTLAGRVFCWLGSGPIVTSLDADDRDFCSLVWSAGFGGRSFRSNPRCLPNRSVKLLLRAPDVRFAAKPRSARVRRAAVQADVSFLREIDGRFRKSLTAALGRELCSAITNTGRCRQSGHAEPRLAPAARPVHWSIQSARTAAVAIGWGQHRARRVRRQRKGHLDWLTHGTISGQVMVAGGSQMLRRLTKCSCTFAWL